MQKKKVFVLLTKSPLRRLKIPSKWTWQNKFHQSTAETLNIAVIALSSHLQNVSDLRSSTRNGPARFSNKFEPKLE